MKPKALALLHNRLAIQGGRLSDAIVVILWYLSTRKFYGQKVNILAKKDVSRCQKIVKMRSVSHAAASGAECVHSMEMAVYLKWIWMVLQPKHFSTRLTTSMAC
ncbi:hypothetical protein GBAR_LOCUS3523 [Geodia barretti]|uniref:Uncharacterized protein n=2 Tax=Geodia barretti TaxID=519541 RepID=A0AA35R3Z9_GEOBA|nr:hypothetical protein GBAR_LOCUS3523 [Geodia barretti]